MFVPRVFQVLAIFSTGILLFGCSHLQKDSMPAWVMGASEQFPAQRYLLGVGEADSRQVAEDRAYAAIAKIFQANVRSQADDTELYRVLKREGVTTEERSLSLGHSTTVTTNKVLEHAGILDRWVHAERQKFYVLAGIDRQQAESGLRERIVTLDETAEAEIRAAHHSGQPLTGIGHFTRALHALGEREQINGDLRIIRESGKGIPGLFQTNQVAREFRSYVEQNLLVQVDVQGDHAQAMRTAIIDGLRKRGLPVLREDSSASVRQNTTVVQSLREPNVLIQGHVHLWPIDVPDPLFVYVRWCGEFVIVNHITQRIIGVAGQAGREGHVTENEALARASSAMQVALTSDIASALSQAILNGGPEVSEPAAHACQADR